MQPHEFYKLWDGYKFRQNNSENMTAYFVAMLMNIQGKMLENDITAKDLLDPIREKPRDTKTDKALLIESFPNLAGY